MQPPENYTEIIGKKRYSVEKSTLIADDAYWDGHNYERRGRNKFLYMTANKNYFYFLRTQWEKERDGLYPITKEEALNMWDELPEKHVEFDEAFPGVEVEDA